MKKLILFFITILLTANFSYSQSAWQTVTLPPSARTFKTSFVNSNTGYLLADAIYKTTNGGLNWVQKYSPVLSSNLSGIYFINELTGYCAAIHDGVVLKTTDGSETWKADTAIHSSDYTDVKFLNQSTGLLLHVNGFVDKTTNGGASFNRYIVTEAPQPCMSMHFLNENTGWITALKGIFKTTNGGINWVNAPNINYFVRAVEFINALTGFAGGQFNYSITSDGGETWQTSSLLPTKTIRDIKFTSAQNGWMCADGLYKTTNGGMNWVKQLIDTTLAPLHCEFINSNTGWITTQTNKILKTTTAGVVFISQTSVSTPDNFSLHQNYPNPFNPSTTISFQIPKGDFVSLKVYDINGKEVSELVNENLQAGEYKINFNASAFPSGVYYYKLTSNNFSETRKMMLVK